MSDDNSKALEPTEPSIGLWKSYIIKYRQQLAAVGIFIFGALGGNVDRLTSALRDLFPPTLDAVKIEERLAALEDITFDLEEKASSNSGRILLLNTKVEALESNSRGGLPYRTSN